MANNSVKERGVQVDAGKRIDIYHLWGLGDFILFLPALEVLYAAYPDAHFRFIFRHFSCRQLLAHFPGRYVTLRATPGLYLKLVFSPARLVFFTTGLRPWKTWPVLAARLLARRRLWEGSFPLPGFLVISPPDRMANKVPNNLRLLRALGVEVPDQLSMPNYLFRERATERRKRIVFHIGSAIKDTFKRWPQEKFFELGRLLLSSAPEYLMALLPGPDELDISRALADDWRRAGVAVELRENLSFADTAQYIDGSALVISNDSFLAHLASLTDTPILRILGPGPPVRSAPFSRGARVVQRTELECVPCFPRLRFGCAERWCLTELEAERVQGVILEMLGVL